MTAAAFDVPADYELTDDLDISNDPETYEDRADPLPLTVGNYAFRVKQGGLKKTKDGELVMIDDRFYVIEFRQVELTGEGVEGRPVYLFQEWVTKPFERVNPVTGVAQSANILAEIIRSHDASLVTRGQVEGITLLRDLIEQGAIFHARFDWVADAWQWRAAEEKRLKEQMGVSRLPKDVVKDLYARSRLQGMKKFYNEKSGTYVPIFVAPDGEEIEARAKIVYDGFISTRRLKAGKVKLGPSIK